MKPIVVLYHNDEDGFGAAWAAWKKFKDKASYIPVEYKNRAAYLEKLKNKEIYLLDLCFNEKTMKKLLEGNKKLVVIDHHIGRKEECKISTERVFDIKSSAAVLSWKFFYPGRPMPNLLRYVEDFDIWKLKMPHTRELFASLDTFKFNFKIWNKLVSDFQSVKRRKKHIEAGRAILKYQDNMLRKIVSSGENVILNGHKAFAVNSPILESEIGHYIYENKGVLGIIWSYQNGVFKTSLRSNKKIDASKLAKKFGGGGHKGAAGFIFNSKINFPWKKTK